MTARILIVDAVPTNRIVLRVKLASAFYEVTLASSGESAIKALTRQRPDLVITASELPDMTGQALCGRIRAHSFGAYLPVILLQANASPSERLAALAAGADDVMQSPVDDLVMLARLRSLLRARDAETELRLREDTRRALGLAEASAGFERPANVALIPCGAGRAAAEDLQDALGHCLSDRLRVVSPEGVLSGNQRPPDVAVLLEARQSEGTGLALLPQLRAGGATRHMSIIYVAHPYQRHEAATALDLGANDLLSNGPDPQELALRIRKQVARKRTADRLREDMRDGLRAAVIDPLTGLYNRRYAVPHMTRIAEQSEMRKRPFALLLADLDHFKSINDKFGHATGDAVLRGVAEMLCNNLRAADLVARYGGEEFLVVMPDTGREAAQATAERLCRTLNAEPLKLEDGRSIPISISLGVAVAHPGREFGPEALVESADQALYAAKDLGRNTVVMADRLIPDATAKAKAVTYEPREKMFSAPRSMRGAS
ncbi:diguanylate cyclase [Cognatishimia sp. F0-27]|uniref:diguanylate cyclase n=1 Tax=Cognatishimia sp. F0-27 TaxID=2816855 RepID=UPI001D0CB5EB|nr:diguanylate cyclase [Cognatishimia sp. F0-27]MCC1492178.1 diguanylate cyclase [Cognatishimia sp. F0-27]